MTNKDEESKKSFQKPKELDPFRFYSNLFKEMEDYRKFHFGIAGQLNKIAKPLPLDLSEKFNLLDRNFAKIVESQSTVSALAKLSEPPGVKLANMANSHVLGMIKNISSNNEIFKQTFLASKGWEEQLRSLRTGLDSSDLFKARLSYHLTGISQTTLLTQVSLLNLPKEKIGNVLKIDAGLKSDLYNSFIDLSKSYVNLFKSFEKSPAKLFSYPPIVSKHPPTELFISTDFLEKISIEELELKELIVEKRNFRKQVYAETENALQTDLKRVDESLITLLVGAKQALESNNPDRARHLTISLRELFTQILHRISPDEAIKRWSNSPEHFSNNRPTRKARLQYICRAINHGPFTNFVESDIKTSLEFLDLFQRGTHEVKVPYTDIQLKALLIKMESLIRFLIEISKSK